jgi:sortase A
MATKSEYLKVFVLRTIGNFFLLCALSGVVLTFAPAFQAEAIYRFNVWRGQSYVVVGDKNPCGDDPRFSDVAVVTEPGKVNCKADTGNFKDDGLLSVKVVEPLAIAPEDTDFGIVIPKIAANSRVIANVDPAKFDVYIEALKHGVAHAEGTAYPGQIGNSFLFAHSVGNFWEVNRWNAVFYLLRELNPGDEIDIFFKGQRFIYVVYDKKIVQPNDTEYIEPQADFAKLTLQTCWPPGTTLRRLLVFARLKD